MRRRANVFAATPDRLTILNIVKKSLYEKAKPSYAGAVINAALVLLALILAAEITFSMMYTGIYVVNVSMTPTLTGATVLYYDDYGKPVAGTDGDYVYIRKGAKPTYGDIVVVSRADVGDNIIKRAVAFEGDRVQFIEGWLYVNGEKQPESYISDNYRTAPNHTHYNYPRGEQYHTVGKDCVFLLGDNRNNSSDSRDYGDFRLKDVLGVVPSWSINCKKFTTAMHAFFYFTLRGKTTAEILTENVL